MWVYEYVIQWNIIQFLELKNKHFALSRAKNNGNSVSKCQSLTVPLEADAKENLSLVVHYDWSAVWANNSLLFQMVMLETSNA
jgi:hypothetical protein